MRFGDEDRAALLDDFGLRLEYGTKDTKGVVDEEERLESGDSGLQVLTRETVILISAQDLEQGFPLYGLAVNDTLTVVASPTESTDYEVREIRRIEDGAFRQVVVAPS
jgi:hypothetical protein